MFVQKRCLFDTYVLQKKKLRRKFRDSLTLWWVHWRMRLFYLSGERGVIMGPNNRQSLMLHMQIPTINISLQHYCYKSLDNACSYFTERKIFVLVLAERFYCIQSISFRCNARKSPISLFLRCSNDYDVNICIKMCNIGLQSY